MSMWLFFKLQVCGPAEKPLHTWGVRISYQWRPSSKGFTSRLGGRLLLSAETPGARLVPVPRLGYNSAGYNAGKSPQRRHLLKPSKYSICYFMVSSSINYEQEAKDPLSSSFFPVALGFWQENSKQPPSGYYTSPWHTPNKTKKSHVLWNPNLVPRGHALTDAKVIQMLLQFYLSCSHYRARLSLSEL